MEVKKKKKKVCFFFPFILSPVSISGVYYCISKLASVYFSDSDEWKRRGEDDD